jgi:hypothetical protein
MMLFLIASVAAASPEPEWTDRGFVLREPETAESIVDGVSGKCQHGTYSINLPRGGRELILTRNGKPVDLAPAAAIGEDLQRPALTRVGISCDRTVAIFSLWWVRFDSDRVQYRSGRIVVDKKGHVRAGPVQEEDAFTFQGLTRQR